MTRKDINLIAEAYASGLPRAYFSDPRGSIADTPANAITDFKDRQKYVALRKMEQQALSDAKRLKDFRKASKIELANSYRDQALEILNKYSKSEDEEVDAEQLQIGIEVELEHTDDEKVAEKIARDHLAEDPQYYTKLTKAGL